MVNGLLSSIVFLFLSCSITQCNADFLAGFYGSDHCPVSLELAEPTLDANNHSEKLNSE